jgi:hypothetical protein
MPLTDYAVLPRRTAGFRSGFGPVRGPSTPQGAGYSGDLAQWARQTVEKVRVATVGGRIRFLPWYDPYTDETPEIRAEYRKMLTESSVKAAFQTKILSVISLDVQCQAVDDDDPRQQEAARFGAYAFRKVKGGMRRVGWSVLHPAIIDGHSVCERVWKLPVEASGPWKGKRIYHAVKAKDTRFLQLGIDPYRNVTAIRGMGHNAGRVWSPSDFIVFSYMELFENPSGTSDFRAAYRPYWTKHTTWQLRGLHLDKFVGPFLKGTYTAQDQKGALEEALTAARATTWMTIPAGCMVEAIDLSMRGTADFEQAIKDCDREILIAIVGAHLQILEGQTTGGRGNTKVHKETAELIQWFLAASLADIYREQLLTPLIAENFHGVEVPDVTVGAVTEEAMLDYLKVDQGLQALGWKLSKRDMGKRYSRIEGEGDDVLAASGGAGGQGQQQPGGGAGASPFSEGALQFCQQGPNKGKPGPCPKEKSGNGDGKAARPAKAPRATADEARAHIEQVKTNPTAEGVLAVAQTLSRMTVKDLTGLKKELGIRAGGNKSALAGKLAHEATRRLTIRQKAEREARALGASPRDLTITARAVRQAHNDVTDQVNGILGEARRQYTQFTDGGRLSRGMKAFRSGDWTEIPHFDQIAESLQSRYPDVLGQESQEGYERLFTLLGSGPPPRLSYEESYRMAIDQIKESGVQPAPARRRAVVEEPLPFAEDEASRDRNLALLDVLLENADNADLHSVVAEMAAEGEQPSAADEDDVPPSEEAQAASARLVSQLVKERLDSAEPRSFCTEGTNKGKPGPCPEDKERVRRQVHASVQKINTIHGKEVRSLERPSGGAWDDTHRQAVEAQALAILDTAAGGAVPHYLLTGDGATALSSHQGASLTVHGAGENVRVETDILAGQGAGRAALIKPDTPPELADYLIRRVAGLPVTKGQQAQYGTLDPRTRAGRKAQGLSEPRRFCAEGK